MSHEGQRLALKLAAAAVCLLWAYISADQQWGVTVTFTLSLAGLVFGASAAKDLGRMGR